MESHGRPRWPVILVAAGMMALNVPALTAQEKPSPTSEYQYGKDLAQVEGIMKETDSQKRAGLLLSFVKEHPQSRMIPYVSSYYGQIVGGHAQAGQWPKVIEMNEAFLALVPDDKTALGSLLGAYFQTQKFDKAAEVGEKVYAQTPDKSVAYVLATSYSHLQSTDKFVHYATKVVAEFPVEQVFGMALQLANVHAGKNDLPKAAEYAEKVIGAFGEKVPQGVQEPAWNASRASLYNIIGANAYANKDCDKATAQYDKVIQFDSKNDTAYYFIGMCKWRNQDTEGAIPSFAKAAVLGKANSKKAQEYLEQLYKARNNDSLDGLENVLAKARSELGVS